MFRTNRTKLCFTLCILLICSAISLMAQQASTADSVVPAMVKFTGTLNDADSKPLTGTQGVTFLLYKEQTGGAPLWMETQNVQADKNGHYTVMLGAATSHGLPADAFQGGEARWLAAQPHGQAEPARLVLVSVPYAMKALDAETLGGRPASAFLTASHSDQAGPQAEQKNEIVCSSTTDCKTGFVPLFSSNGGSAKVTDSIVSQSGSTVSVAGSEKTTGDITAGGNLNASGNANVSGNVNATGNVNAATVQTSVVNSSNTSGGNAVIGVTSSGTYGVYGENDSTTGGKGVFGFNKQGFEGFGVQGLATGSDGIGIGGSTGSFGTVAKSIFGTAPIGVIGDSTSGYGIVATSDNSNALVVENKSGGDTAVIINLGGGAPLYAAGTGGSLFLDGNGNLSVSGAIFAGTKDFKIDHPLDPANKYLYHASIESSEMKNIYDGVATLDAAGSATVILPDWFEAVNGDFRYQLTAMGAPGPNLHIAQEISNHQFAIAGGQPGMKVSWQVTGIRHDAYAKAHPLLVSVDKTADERGYYIHPELYGAPVEKSLAESHRRQTMQNANQK